MECCNIFWLLCKTVFLYLCTTIPSEDKPQYNVVLRLSRFGVIGMDDAATEHALIDLRESLSDRMKVAPSIDGVRTVILQPDEALLLQQVTSHLPLGDVQVQPRTNDS